MDLPVSFVNKNLAPIIHLSEAQSSDKMKTCDYCGEPMAVWVGIRRTCYAIECRERAKQEQMDTPKVNLYQMLELIRQEERRREVEETK